METLKAITDFFTSPFLSFSIITFISLLVNAITIYKLWSDKHDHDRINDQAFQMIRGLALGACQRGRMFVERMTQLRAQNDNDNEKMMFLENSYADSNCMVENLLATAKALKSDQVDTLPYDGDCLAAEVTLQSLKIRLEQKKLREQLDANNSRSSK